MSVVRGDSGKFAPVDEMTKAAHGGRRPGAGRPKGKPNKLTLSAKEMIEQAVKELGGKEWLMECARKDPGPLHQLLGRLIPKDLTVSGGGSPIIMQIISGIDPKLGEPGQHPREA